jgi:hypothetical protein
MKFTIEMNVYELNHSMATGTFQALCNDVQEAEGEARKAPKAAPETKTAAEPEQKKDTPADNKPDTPSEEKPGISEEEIRAKFVDLSKKGKKKELKDLLTALGVEKVSDLKPEQYQEAWTKLEAI